MHATLNGRGADRRKYPRFPMNGALELRASGLEIPINATVKDISAGGCRLDCRVPLPLKQAVRMELPMPGANPLVITGNVVRIATTAAEKMHHYGVRFRIETAALRDNLVTYISRYCQHKLATRASDRRVTGFVDVRFSVTISAPDVKPFHALAIALGTEGLRVSSDRILRQEWSMKIDIKLPGGMIGQPILTMMARAKPGAKPVRGTYVQDVVFVEPPLRSIAEIERSMAEIKQKHSRRAS